MLAANVGARDAAASTGHALLLQLRPPPSPSPPPRGAGARRRPGHGAAAALPSTSGPDARVVGQLSGALVQERVSDAVAAGIGALPFAAFQETKVTHIAVLVLTCPSLRKLWPVCVNLEAGELGVNAFFHRSFQVHTEVATKKSGRSLSHPCLNIAHVQGERWLSDVVF